MLLSSRITTGKDSLCYYLHESLRAKIAAQARCPRAGPVLALLQSYQTVLGLYMLFRAVLRAVHLAHPICPTIEKTSERVHTWRDHRIDILSSLSARPRGEGRRNKSTRPIKLNPLPLFHSDCCCFAVLSLHHQLRQLRRVIRFPRDAESGVLIPCIPATHHPPFTTQAEAYMEICHARRIAACTDDVGEDVMNQ